MKSFIQQFLKFGVVGAVSFLIDTGLMMLLHNVVGVNLIFSNICSFTVSVIFNYTASMRYVFESRDDLSKTKEFIIFVVLSLVGGIINTVIIWLVVDVAFSSLDSTTALYDFLCLAAKIFATAIVTVYNFVTRKIFLEKKS